MVDMVYYRQRKSTHSKVDAPEKTYLCPNGHRLFRWQTEQAFYFFFLFSLSPVRKARNATIKLPKVINKVNIPINKDKISYAVIVTHLPSYVVHHVLLRSGIGSGGYHPVMGKLFLWQSPRPISCIPTCFNNNSCNLYAKAAPFVFSLLSWSLFNFSDFSFMECFCDTHPCNVPYKAKIREEAKNGTRSTYDNKIIQLIR